MQTTYGSNTLVDASTKYNANRISYLQVAADQTSTTADLTNSYVAHTFGRLGQSEQTNIANGKPFVFQENPSATTVRAGF